MNTNIENLNQLPLNKIGKIKKIDCEECIKRRLLDMGLVKGTNIEPILVSPSKDPRAFLVRGTIIAIRKEDAKDIKIIYIFLILHELIILFSFTISVNNIRYINNFVFSAQCF